jgi:hypothetical protein
LNVLVGLHPSVRRRRRKCNIRIATAEPVNREPAAHTRDREPAESGKDGPQQPTRPLRREVQGQAEAEEAVRWPQDPEIERRDRPQLREQRCPEADESREDRRHPRPDPGDPFGSGAIAGPDVRPDHRHQRRSESEHQRDLQILEPHSHPVAGEGPVPNGPTSPVSRTTVRFAWTSFRRLGTPNHKISPNSRPWGRRSARASRTRLLPDSRYTSKTRLPAA